ncbi:MAG: nitroreductase family protein, partial [Dehalococcoidales bacterium]|nr:nitroreductase family protein [Dehalococcoidales bacterium]
QSVMLAALSFGLGTCATATVVHYPNVLRQILGIPERQKIICGMAMGYPDWQHPANKIESQRETVASFTRWCGF